MPYLYIRRGAEVSVTRIYYCDLCNANGNGEPLRGLYWKREVTRECLVERPMREVEHHICEKCLADLKTFPAKPGDQHE